MYVHPSYCPFTNTSFSLFVHHPSFATVPTFIHFAPPVYHHSPQALKWREYRRKNPLGVERGKDGPRSLSCALETKKPGTRVMRRNVFDFPSTNQPLSFGRLNGAEPISNTQQGLKGMSRKGGWGGLILFVNVFSRHLSVIMTLSFVWHQLVLSSTVSVFDIFLHFSDWCCVCL